MLNLSRCSTLTQFGYLPHVRHCASWHADEPKRIVAAGSFGVTGRVYTLRSRLVRYGKLRQNIRAVFLDKREPCSSMPRPWLLYADASETIANRLPGLTLS
jgi:hypothetical protein